MYIFFCFCFFYIARIISKEMNDEDNTVEINLNINLDLKNEDDIVDATKEDISSGIPSLYC